MTTKDLLVSTRTLKQELHDLASEVHKAHKRYDGVATALVPYATALDTAKAGSMSALHDAEHAQEAQTKASASPNPQATPGGKPLTADQKNQAKSHASAVNAANDALNAAKTKLEGVLTDLNSAGKKAANAINDHNDDALKDHHHWWDVVVKIMKIVVELMNYAVLVLALAALVCGAGWILVAIVALSIAILAIDTTLAVTGNGSWLDVGIDAVGVLTLGVGTAASKGAEMAAKSATRIGARSFAREIGDRAGLNLLQRGMTYFRRLGAGRRLAERLVSTASKGTFAQRLAVGDRTILNSIDEVGKLSSRFPEATKIADRMKFATNMSTYTKVSFRVGNGLIGLNGALSPSNVPYFENHKPSFTPLEHLKQVTTVSGMRNPPKAEEFKWSEGVPSY